MNSEAQVEDAGPKNARDAGQNHDLSFGLRTIELGFQTIARKPTTPVNKSGDGHSQGTVVPRKAPETGSKNKLTRKPDGAHTGGPSHQLARWILSPSHQLVRWMLIGFCMFPESQTSLLLAALYFGLNCVEFCRI